MKKSKVALFIEGNVGAGKSTLLEIVQKRLEVDVFYEPHTLWQSVGEKNLLEMFFLDPKRWAFTLQTYVTTTQIEQQKKAAQKESDLISLFERSVYASRYCFALNAYQTGLMNSVEWHVYLETWQSQVQALQELPSGFIYLRIPAQICYERIQGRNRFEEEPITLEYIEQLEQKYDDWLLHGKQVLESLTKVPVLLLDDTRDFVHDFEVQQSYITKIHNFIETVVSKGNDQ